MPEQEQPTYPMTNIGMQPDGSLQIVTMISATAGIIQILPEAALSQILANVVQSKRDLKKQQELIADVMRSKAR